MNNRCGIFFGGCRNFYFSKGKFVWPRRPAKADILAEARLWSIRKRTNFCLTFAAFFTNFIRNKNVRSSIKSPSHKYVSTIRFHVVSNFNNSDAWRPCRKQLAAVSASGLHYREVFPHPSLFSFHSDAIWSEMHGRILHARSSQLGNSFSLRIASVGRRAVRPEGGSAARKNKTKTSAAVLAP
jgi:hypothetical protein